LALSLFLREGIYPTNPLPTFKQTTLSPISEHCNLAFGYRSD
jgi:hypothetical protein